MISKKADEATVYIHLPGEGYIPAGILEYLPSANRSVFTYGRRYVRRENALPLDPIRLPLSFAGHARTPDGMAMFNALRDAAPDRWGRKVLALHAGRAASTFSEFEILTALFTPGRIGALAFGPDPRSGPKSMADWAGTGDLFARTRAQLLEMSEILSLVEKTPEDELDALRDRLPDDAFLEAFTSLYSVGGARPKAMVSLDGRDWIAKFPKADDVWDEPLVEHATMTLATKCGIDAAQTRILESGEGHILLVRRFDRDHNGEPRHFVSGFTMLDVQEDGAWGGYQDLAFAARRLGDPDAPVQLFRRMVFNALCANFDDHPRNHAFFVERHQVRLTPAFDLVPRQIRTATRSLALACGLRGREATATNLLSRTEPFGLDRPKAESVFEEIRDAVSAWREHFAAKGVREKDLRELSLRFQHKG